MSLKKHLKAAKAAIDHKSGKEALECSNEALTVDPDNYFAHLFQARAYQLLGKQKEVEEAFQRAVEIEPNNLLGWRGYLQAVKEGSDHQKFFQVLTSSVQKLADQNELLASVPKELYAYLHKSNFKSDSELSELYLRSILPGTPLGSLLEGRLGDTAENIRKLLILVKTREDLQVLKEILRQKIKMPQRPSAEMHQQLASLEWSIRQGSGLDNYYLLFIQYCDDDMLRRKYEVEYLKYKQTLLRIAPEKALLLAEVKEMAADLVLLDTRDVFPWTLHFDFRDDTTLADLEPGLLLRFLKFFKNEPLGLVLYLFVMSDQCPLDRTYFQELDPTKEATPEINNEVEIIVSTADVREAKTVHYSQAEVMEVMAKGFKGCSDSVLAHRIAAHVNNFYSEYSANLKVCANGVRRVKTHQSSYGEQLHNAYEDLTCQLALVYTYYEAPKNFGRAFQVFNQILENNPQNEQALMGKALILIEKGKYDEAQQLLTQLMRQFPGNSQALNDLGWCYVLQRNYERGRDYLREALTHISGASLRAMEMRSNIIWRISTSFLEEDLEKEANVNAAYELLLSSLKNNSSHAPSYTLLGRILQEHYHDKPRAQKCFYKAFELDGAEITAAKYLVEDLCAKSEWEVTEVLCERVVELEKSRILLFSQLNTDPDRSWPYRVLGCSALNRQNDAKAVEWFQTALRIQAMDIECWTGLGEAYFNCGRIDAAIKVFQHTTKLDSCTWVNFYLLGQAVCIVGDFGSGLELLEKALDMNPGAQCIASAIYEQRIMYAAQLMQSGYIGRTLECNSLAISAISLAVTKNSGCALWKALGDCIALIGRIQHLIETTPFEELMKILLHAKLLGKDSVATSSSVDEGEDFEAAQSLWHEQKYVDCVAILGILAGKAALASVTKKENKLIRAAVLFNLGIAYVNAFQISHEQNMAFRDNAIRSLKDAIRLELQNAQYWLALGVAYVTFNPSLLQHAFIKASVLDSKDVTAWTNLAALYLHCHDEELAQEAFERAASVAPALATPWLGKALAADAAGDTATSCRLATHAQVLSNGTDPLAQLCYAVSVVQSRIQTGSDSRNVAAVQETSVAHGAIRRFLHFQPDNIAGLKLAFLLSERCHTYELSAEVGKNLCAAIEKAYEKSESSSLVIDLAVAKTQLARVLLGSEKYDQAVENARDCLDLLSEEKKSESVVQAELSSRIAIGLSFFFNQQYGEALEEFQFILDEHSLSHKVVTLIAQILYALDSPDSRQAALDRLFSFIEENESSLLIVLTLGAISLADNHTEYFEAVRDELQGLPLTELMEDSRSAVPRILNELNQALDKKSGVWQRFALLFPGDFRIWSQLNTKMALSSALVSDAHASAPDVSVAYVEQKTRRNIQRSLLIYADNETARAALAVE